MKLSEKRKIEKLKLQRDHYKKENESLKEMLKMYPLIRENTFELNITLSEEFYRELLSYGSGIEIVEPDFVRQEIASRIKEMFKLYE